jgi:carotenoid cleavage dioxygenase-like enzyme
MWDGLGPDPAGPGAAAAASGLARMYRWVLDPASGTVTETLIDDRGVEFPTVDDERVGRDARYRYAVGRSAVVKFDVAAGKVTEHALGADTVAGEAVFVPSAVADRAEDDGWLLTITTRRDGSASQLLVLDATHVAGAPVAAVTLPRGVPAGFHGSWIPDNELDRA